jgi:hypothetical protein
VTCSCRQFHDVNLLCYRCGSRTGEPSGGNKKRSAPKDTLTTRTWVQEERRLPLQLWPPLCPTLSRISGLVSGNRSKAQVPRDWPLLSAWVAGILRCRRVPCCLGATSATTRHRIISRAPTTARRLPRYFLPVSATSRTVQLQRPARSRASSPTYQRHSAPSCRVRAPSETTTSMPLLYWPQRPLQPWHRPAARSHPQGPQVQHRTSTEGAPALRPCG